MFTEIYIIKWIYRINTKRDDFVQIDGYLFTFSCSLQVQTYWNTVVLNISRICINCNTTYECDLSLAVTFILTLRIQNKTKLHCGFIKLFSADILIRSFIISCQSLACHLRYVILSVWMLQLVEVFHTVLNLSNFKTETWPSSVQTYEPVQWGIPLSFCWQYCITYLCCYTVHVVELLNYYTNHCTYIKFIKFTH